MLNNKQNVASNSLWNFQSSSLRGPMLYKLDNIILEMLTTHKLGNVTFKQMLCWIHPTFPKHKYISLRLLEVKMFKLNTYQDWYRTLGEKRSNSVQVKIRSAYWCIVMHMLTSPLLCFSDTLLKDATSHLHFISPCLPYTQTLINLIRRDGGLTSYQRLFIISICLICFSKTQFYRSKYQHNGYAGAGISLC